LESGAVAKPFPARLAGGFLQCVEGMPEEIS
jgi:hypothetical protein